MKKNNFQELYQEIENDCNSGEIQEIRNEANKERRKFNKIALIICLILDILIISFIQLPQDLFLLPLFSYLL